MEWELKTHGPNIVDHNLFVRTIITTSLFRVEDPLEGDARLRGCHCVL